MPKQIIFRPATWESFQAEKLKRQLQLACRIDQREVSFPVHAELRSVPAGILLNADDA